MADLDTPIARLFEAGQESRRLLSNVIASVQQDTGLDFVAALQRVHEAAEAAYDQGEATLAGVLKHARGDAVAMANGLKVLEARDSAVSSAAASVPHPEIPRDVFGRVLLDGSYGSRPKSLDADGRLQDPQEFEDRLWPGSGAGPSLPR